MVEGDLTGSWTGISADVVMMNWNINALRTSATWFATPTYAHPQVLANYYDSGDGDASLPTPWRRFPAFPEFKD